MSRDSRYTAVVVVTVAVEGALLGVAEHTHDLLLLGFVGLLMLWVLGLALAVLHDGGD